MKKLVKRVLSFFSIKSRGIPKDYKIPAKIMSEDELSKCILIPTNIFR